MYDKWRPINAQYRPSKVTGLLFNLNIVNFDQRKYHKVYLILNPAVQIKEMEMASHKVDSLGRLKSWGGYDIHKNDDDYTQTHFRQGIQMVN